MAPRVAEPSRHEHLTGEHSPGAASERGPADHPGAPKRTVARRGEPGERAQDAEHLAPWYRVVGEQLMLAPRMRPEVE
jgi:hypothetical protein